MMKNLIAFCLFAPAAGLCAAGAQDGAQIAENGTPLVKIATPDSPTECEKFAAKDIKLHLDKICGAKFEIVRESELAEGTRAIYVGNTKKSRKAVPDFDPKTAPFDSIRIKTDGGDVFITGHKRRGTIYAASEFLEEHLGVKWWDKDNSFIPKNPSPKVGKIDKFYAPPLVFRQTNYIPSSFDFDFAARMKNGQIRGAPKLSREVSQSYAVPYHSAYKILPPEKYFKEHPEWYALVDGKRAKENAQLCLTNREMRAEFLKVVREKLAKNSTARFAHISQNDHRNPCTCENCKAFEDAHGGVHSATIVDFANYIAENLEADYPELAVVTFAYEYSRKAPTGIRPRKNLWIELCSIECDFAHPLESDTDYGFTKDIREWSKLTKNLTIWNYTACFTNYIIPYPNVYLIGGDIRFFVENGAIGLFEQGDSFCCVGDLIDLRLWVMSKLMWNPNLDDQKLVGEFLEGYYGKEIAPLYREYLDALENRARSVKYAQGCYYIDTLTWLDAKTYNKAAKAMADALAKAKKLEAENPKLHKGLVKKVWRDKISIDYVGVMYRVQLERAAEREGVKIELPADVEAGARDLINRFRNFGASGTVPYMKREKFESLFPDFLSFAAEQKKYLAAAPKAHNPSDLLGLFKEGTFADFQEDAIDISGNGRAGGWAQIPPQYVADPAASNGWAARNHYCKRFEIQLRDRLLKLKSASGDENSNKFKIYIFAKSKNGVRAGKFHWLNYNVVARKRLQRERAPEFPASEDYKMVEIGTLEHPDIRAARKDAVCMQFMLYTGKNPDLLIDRIVFVRQ